MLNSPSIADSSNTPATSAVAARWSAPRRILFRFLFVYGAFYYLPFPLDVFPDEGWVDDTYEKPWKAIVVWVARHVFHATADIQTDLVTGSGDTTYDYFKVATYALLAAVAAALWSALDRRRPEYARLEGAFRVFVRYAVGVTLLSYGFSKVIQTQFPGPSLDRLVEPIGELSPMGLLWTFMGHSRAYNFFTGGAEVLGGLLLLFRRTTTLGALLVVAVMANVVLLNFSYDVPVKLYSTHLLVSALLLAAPDAGRLVRVLVLNRATRPRAARQPFDARWKEIARHVAKGAFILWILGHDLHERMKRYADHEAAPAQSPIYGIWDVEAFTRDGVATLPLLTDTQRWRRVVASGTSITVRAMDDAKATYRFEADVGAGTLALTGWKDKTDTLKLAYRRVDADHLTLEGQLHGAAIVATLHRVDTSSFLLVNRGFHWISEYPFNR